MDNIDDASLTTRIYRVKVTKIGYPFTKQNDFPNSLTFYVTMGATYVNFFSIPRSTE